MLGCQIKSLRVLLVTVTIAIAAMGYFYQALQYIPQIPCPIVNTTLGSLQGYTAISRDGREYFGFLGIPFAEPPVGNLRFEVNKINEALGMQLIVGIESLLNADYVFDDFLPATSARKGMDWSSKCA